MSQTVVTMGWDILDRMERAVVKVRERLLRATKALNGAGIPYAVVGGHAVASWVATIDEGAVRNTRDVELLVRREDYSVITTALKRAGFVKEKALGLPIFGDKGDAMFRQAVCLIFVGDKTHPNPEITTITDASGLPIIALNSLLVMLLVADRNEDAMYLRDLIDVGLIDQSWIARLPAELGERLQHILDTPCG